MHIIVDSFSEEDIQKLVESIKAKGWTVEATKTPVGWDLAVNFHKKVEDEQRSS